MADNAPSYLDLFACGELAHRAKTFRQALRSCNVCAHRCGVDRTAGELGECRTGVRAVVGGAHPHLGEETCLVGEGGSGTIFFSWCNMHCEYCQNYALSEVGEGRDVSPEDLAGIMLDLQRQGCININLVSPSHVVPQIVDALLVAVEGGLHLPIVYNTGGFDNVRTIRMLDGIVDIYMPDMKYNDNEVGLTLSGAANYPRMNRAAVLEMYRQVGDLVLDDDGIAQRGLLVRHLVLPRGLAGTEGVMQFLAHEVSRDTYVHLIDQYRPCHRACDRPQLSRPITQEEYDEAMRLAREAGLHRFYSEATRSAS